MKVLPSLLKKTLIFLLIFFCSSLTSKASEIDSLRTIVDTISESRRAQVYNRLFVLNGRFIQNDTSLYYAEQALHYGTVHNDTFNMAFAHRNIGFYLNAKHDPAGAIPHYHHSLKLLKSIQDLRRTFVIYNELSDILISSRKYNDASTLLFEALDYCESMDYAFGMIGTHRNLGSLYRQLNEAEKAKEHILKAIEVTEKQEKINRREQSSLYRTLGLINFDQKNFELAKSNYEKSLEILKDLDDPRLLMMLYNSMALVHSKLNEREQALAKYQLALEYAKESQNQNLVTAALLNIGHEYTNLGKFSEAKPYLTDGLKLADEYGFIKWQRNAHKYLFKNYYETGDYKNALQHQLEYQFFEDSLKIEENQLKIAELETIYETDKKEKQIDLLNKENEIKTLRLRQTRNLILTMVIVFLLALLSIINYIRLNRRRMRDNAIIEKQELEKKLLSTVISTEDKERKRFAADLHDGLGPLLSSVKLYLGAMENADETKKGEMLSIARDLINQSISSARNISNNLLPVELSEKGLIHSIQRFCDKIQFSSELEFKLTDKSENHRFDAPTEIILYRIIQELINNTLKHASANFVGITFIKTNQFFRVEYTDDGTGFDLEDKTRKPGQGLGLNNIKERAMSVEGKLMMDSEPGKGTKVELILNI